MEKICVLLSTYNGEKYLDEQIKSLLAQKNVELTLLARDDGSKDRTQEMLREWAEKEPAVRILEENFGTNYGVAKSFTYLLNCGTRMFPEISFFFFADQDDFWLETKCCRAVQRIAAHRDEPALYFSAKKLVDGELKPLPRKDIIRLTGTFWDYFDRSNAFGCTMCLTRPLAEMLQNDRYYEKKFLHDNYIYRLCLAAGVPIVYDKAETILYRQHGANVAGAAKRSLFRGIRRLFDKNRTHVIREMSEYLIGTHGSALNADNAAVMKLLSDSAHSVSAKLKLIKMYHKQKNRGSKEKLLFDVSILLNYF